MHKKPHAAKPQEPDDTLDESEESRAKATADDPANKPTKSAAKDEKDAKVGDHVPGHEHDDDKLLDADGKEQKTATGSFVKHKPSGKVGVLMHYDKSDTNPDGKALVHMILVNAGGAGITASPMNCHLCDLEFMYR